MILVHGAVDFVMQVTFFDGCGAKRPNFIGNPVYDWPKTEETV